MGVPGSWSVLAAEVVEGDGQHAVLPLEGYGFRWLRVRGDSDLALP